MSSYYDQDGFSAIQLIRAGALPFEAGNVVKYVLRAGRKPGETVDQALSKAVHYCELAQTQYSFEIYDYAEVAEAFGQPGIAAHVLGAIMTHPEPNYEDAQLLLLDWKLARSREG